MTLRKSFVQDKINTRLFESWLALELRLVAYNSALLRLYGRGASQGPGPFAPQVPRAGSAECQRLML